MADEAGTALVPLSLLVDADVVHRYGVVAADFNPIHFDDEAARTMGLPKAIAHGMIGGALVSRFLAERLGEQWLRESTLELKFVRPTLVGDTLTVRGRARAEDPLSIELSVENEDGQPVIVGVARLPKAGG